MYIYIPGRHESSSHGPHYYSHIRSLLTLYWVSFDTMYIYIPGRHESSSHGPHYHPYIRSLLTLYWVSFDTIYIHMYIPGRHESSSHGPHTLAHAGIVCDDYRLVLRPDRRDELGGKKKIRTKKNQDDKETGAGP